MTIRVENRINFGSNYLIMRPNSEHYYWIYSSAFILFILIVFCLSFHWISLFLLKEKTIFASILFPGLHLYVYICALSFTEHNVSTDRYQRSTHLVGLSLRNTDNKAEKIFLWIRFCTFYREIIWSKCLVILYIEIQDLKLALSST